MRTLKKITLLIITLVSVNAVMHAQSCEQIRAELATYKTSSKEDTIVKLLSAFINEDVSDDEDIEEATQIVSSLALKSKAAKFKDFKIVLLPKFIVLECKTQSDQLIRVDIRRGGKGEITDFELEYTTN